MNIRKFGFCILTVIFLFGCQGNPNEIRIHNNTDENEQKADEIFVNDDRLSGAVVLLHEKDLLAGVSVRTFSRFQKAKIEKELTKELEKEYPDLRVTVSADAKIIMETNKLLKKSGSEDLKKKVEELINLSKEET